MKYVTFTNNISLDLMKWMEKYSAKEKLTRRAVLERALTEFRKSVRKKEYKNSFQKVFEDSEIKGLAESGLADYSDQLRNLES